MAASISSFDISSRLKYFLLPVSRFNFISTLQRLGGDKLPPPRVAIVARVVEVAAAIRDDAARALEDQFRGGRRRPTG